MLFLLVVQSIFAETITKVLQNGKEGYEGCKDSYNYSMYPEYFDENFETSERLFNHNCQT